MITIEPIVFTIRIGDENHSYGDPYTSACTAVKVGVDTLRITGFAGNFTARQTTMFFRKIKEMGFNFVIWERIKDGKYIDTVKELK
jgi:hypothetical protein